MLCPTCPHIEPLPPPHPPTATIPIRFEKAAATLDSAPFISAREFARVLLGAPTIYLALPLVCAHWAIVQGWAEPHYLGSVGLLPAGTVVVYTPKNREELAICYSLFFAAYHSAFPRKNDQAAIASLEMSSTNRGNAAWRPRLLQLTLNDAVAAALENHPTIKTARAKWESARQRIPQTPPWEDPKLNFNSLLGRFVAIG